MIDQGTLSYFDGEAREYSPQRLKYTVEIINRLRRGHDSLVDIGCGTGNILEYIKNETGITELCGMDISPACLTSARARTGCRTLLGSILDAEIVASLQGRFRFAVLSAVLHHLVGKSRRESKNNALAAIRHSLRLVEDNGFLIILEPTYSTSLAMDLAFYVKKLGEKVTTGRTRILELINLGPPLVSYLSHHELLSMCNAVDHCEIIGYQIRQHRLSPLLKLALITSGATTTLVVHKKSR